VWRRELASEWAGSAGPRCCLDNLPTHTQPSSLSFLAFVFLGVPKRVAPAAVAKEAASGVGVGLSGGKKVQVHVSKGK
jgi:hypothetical protein